MLGVFITSASRSAQAAFIIHLYLKSYSIPERLFPAQSDGFASAAAAARQLVFFLSSVLLSFLCVLEATEVKVAQQQQTVDFGFGDFEASASFFHCLSVLRRERLHVFGSKA